MMVFKFAMLLSVELFVLIAALFLLVYITRQQVSKWFTYGSISIIIAIILIMVCTICCSIMMKHHGRHRIDRELRMQERDGPGPMMMHRMHRGGCPEEMMMHQDNCCKEMKECEEGEDCEGMPSCKKGMREERCMKKEIIISEKDSMPKKEVIIKKK